MTAATLYADTSALVAEFACAVHAKQKRGETTPQLASVMRQTLINLIAKNALHNTAVMREDYAFVQRVAPQTARLIRGANALHLAVAARMEATHFASLDRIQRVAACNWLPRATCVPTLAD